MSSGIEEFFNDIFRALEHTRATSNLPGSLFSGLGIVIDNQDPDSNLRVKVRYPNGQESDWVPYAAPFYGFYPDRPPIGTTVLISYVNGDPTRPVYTGVLVNALNPNQGSEGATTLVAGRTKLAIGDDNVSIDGKQVVTVDGKDTRNDTIDRKGWGNYPPPVIEL